MLTVSADNKFDWKNISLVDCLEGNALDTYFTAKIYGILRSTLEERKLIKLYENLIAPLSELFARIEYDGLLISQTELDKLDRDISAKLENIIKNTLAMEEVGEEVNLSSTRDLMKVLFSLAKNEETKELELVEGIGFGMYPPIQTPGGIPSTDFETLNKLNSIINDEISRRKLND